MTCRALPVLLAIIVANCVSADAPPEPKTPAPTLAEELSKHRMPLALTDGMLRGPGADFIVREAASAEFVLVGEDHGLAVMPRFTAALFERIRPAGFRHLAVEAGPLVAAHLETLAASRDAQERFAAFNGSHPLAAAFYGWREEAKMMERVVKSMDGAPGTVWGLDQEFIGSGSFLLERLEPIAPDDAARALVDRHLSTARGDLQRMIAKHGTDTAFAIAAEPTEIAGLKTAFAAVPAAEGILHELESTNLIYRMNSDGRGWQSNFERARLAKEHFRAAYERAASQDAGPPRVLLKYGAMHMKRGRSMLGVHDIGNLASELAEFNGLKSFHILVIVVRGTVNRFHPFVGDETARHAPYDAVPEFDGFADVKPLIAAADPDAWTLIDTRPVRKFLNRRYSSLDRGLIECLWGYDAVLVIPESEAATSF